MATNNSARILLRSDPNSQSIFSTQRPRHALWQSKCRYRSRCHFLRRRSSLVRISIPIARGIHDGNVTGKLSRRLTPGLTRRIVTFMAGAPGRCRGGRCPQAAHVSVRSPSQIAIPRPPAGPVTRSKSSAISAWYVLGSDELGAINAQCSCSS